MSQVKSIIVAVVVCASLVRAAAAQDDEFKFVSINKSIGVLEWVHVRIRDGVDGGCWTNSTTIKSKVTLLLEQSDLPTIDYEPAFFNARTGRLTIGAFGLRDSAGRCMVTAYLEVEAPVIIKYGNKEEGEYSLQYVGNIFESNAIFGSRNNTNEQLSDWFDGAASEFATAIISARRSPEIVKFRDAYPFSKPLSQEEWDKFISGE